MAHPPSQPPQPQGSVRLSNPNIFSDDFALEPFELIDNPPILSRDHGENHGAVSGSLASDTPRQSWARQQTISSSPGSLRRSRGSQRSDLHSSISSRPDDTLSRSSQPTRSITSVSDLGNTASTSRRSDRTISTFGFSRAQSPYQGATGPSHPYGLYSQDIGLTRTPSTATTSTIRRPERSYSGPNGPTQPYGMYPQNTVPEDDLSSEPGMAHVAAGFPAHGQEYQRRLGPDGEDVDDFIGPDGYTEQLPPYSQHANGVPPKYTSGIGTIRSVDPAHVQNSQETLTSPRARDDAVLENPFEDNSSAQLDSNLPTDVYPKDEGGSFKERVKEKSKRKVLWGLLPCWLFIAILLIVFLSVLLGGVIGGVVAHERQKAEAAFSVTTSVSSVVSSATVTNTSPPDAVTLSSTPSNLPALPTGTYSVALSSPTNTNSCLMNGNQSDAWDCANGASLTMEVSMVGPNEPVVSLSYPTLPSPQIRYGAQPPELCGPASLILMNDRDALKQGPAYAFAQEFNKTVILHAWDLPGGMPAAPAAKRSFWRRWLTGDTNPSQLASVSKRDDSQWTDNSIAKPTDRPWYCFWNATILEGFIYINQSSSQAMSNSAAASSAYPSASYTAATVNTGLPPYPKLVKIEERRNPRSFGQPGGPYCQQMQILNTNQPGPLVNPETGQIITVQLSEIEPQTFVQHQFAQQQAPGGSPASAPTSAGYGSVAKSKRSSIPTWNAPSCQCDWMSTG